MTERWEDGIAKPVTTTDLECSVSGEWHPVRIQASMVYAYALFTDEGYTAPPDE